jgi:RimJ/RimL family protein N-acetyltransferase
MIITARLALMPASVASLEAEAAGDLARLAALLGVESPADWPPELYDDEAVAWTLRAFAEGRERAPWLTYYLVRKADKPELVGVGGFMSPPTADGTVEIGYSVLRSYRRRGFASEATCALVAMAFEERSVRRVVAHTFPHLEGSIGVLRRCGFRREGAGTEPDTVRYVCERRSGEGLPRHALGA